MLRPAPLTPWLLALAIAPALAQTPAAAPPADPAARAAKAIADYEALGKDPKKAAQRQRAMLWLGEVDSPEVTAYLQKELAAAGDQPFAASVLQAIAKVPRPGLFDAVEAVLLRASAPPAVRNSAATTLAGLGNRGIDRLLDLARQGSDPQKRLQVDAAVAGLVASKQERALGALVLLLQDGTAPERQAMLRRLEAVQKVPAISAARAKLVKEATLDVAATAWRQLAVEGDPRARELTVDLFERLPEDPEAAIAAELVIGLAIVQDPDFYPVLLRLCAGKAEPVRRALRTAAKHAGKDPALVRFLVDKGLADDKPGVREAALVLLREAPPEGVAPLLTKVRAELKKPSAKTLDLAIGLHDLLAKDPAWRTEVLALASSRDAAVQTVGLSLLLELGADTAIPQAQQALGDKDWALRSAAIRYLTKFRDSGSIPKLIARSDKEEGRLAQELNQALFVHTGTRCWSRKEWEAWWAKHRTGFALPPEQAVGAGAVATSGGGGGGGRTSSYYDIPMVSSRCAFLIDLSGSMREPIGTDRKYTRLEAAKQKLVEVLESLPDTHHVNVVAYDTGVAPVWDALRKLNKANRDELVDKVRKFALGGSTNIFDALETAFRDPQVDTIYLLTDGQPSAGRLTNADDILDEVRRWNRQRQVVIHCIGLGIDAPLLKQLAADTGGVYRYVR